jgi:tetratricopeptide (TPR) repeat protein
MADEGRNLEEAEKLIRRAVELDRQRRKSGTKKISADDGDDHAAYIDSLGWVLFRQGRLEEARQELEKATKLPEGDSAEIWDHLGDVFFRMGNAPQARAAWEKAEQLYRQERRRRQDDQYQGLQRKLKLIKQQTRR